MVLDSVGCAGYDDYNEGKEGKKDAE